MWCRMNIRCQKETSFMSEVISRTEDNRGHVQKLGHGAWLESIKESRERGGQQHLVGVAWQDRTEGLERRLHLRGSAGGPGSKELFLKSLHS